MRQFGAVRRKYEHHRTLGHQIQQNCAQRCKPHLALLAPWGEHVIQLYFGGLHCSAVWPSIKLCRTKQLATCTCSFLDACWMLQENIDLMAAYLPLDRFKAIYVVDLCHSLCVQAREKVLGKGWTNVHVVEGDACTWQLPEGKASLVTFSYCLSSTPCCLISVYSLWYGQLCIAGAAR